MTAAGQRFTFVVLKEDEHDLVAQCLERDFGASGRSWDDLIYEVQRTVVATLAVIPCAAGLDNWPETPQVHRELAGRIKADLLLAEVVSDEEVSGSRRLVVRVTRGYVAAENPWFVGEGPDPETTRYWPGTKGE